MTEFKLPHYTELVKGDLWLMASGKIAHLIGTDLLGDASFLFRYNDGTLVQTYPGLPGCKDQPIMLWETIKKEVDASTKEAIDAITKLQTDRISNTLIDSFKEVYKDVIGMEYDEHGTFIGYIPKSIKEQL